MTTRRFFYLISMIAGTGLMLLFGQKARAGDFTLVKQAGSILLYERWIRHNAGTVRELKAEFTVRSVKPDELVGLLRNESKGLIWNTNAEQYQVIPQKQADAWQAYIRYDTPWPMDDYDCLLEYHYESAAKPKVVSFQSTVSNRFPLSEEITRIRGTRGRWILEEQGAVLKITYLVTTDRDKRIPRWISDPVIHDNLFKTMSRFKQLLEEK